MEFKNDRDEQKNMIEMKKSRLVSANAGSLVAATLGFAGPAHAGITTDPVAPHYSVDNHDEVNTTNGFVDDAI